MNRMKVFIASNSPKMWLSLMWVTLLTSLLLGCQTSSYDQEAGPTAKWADRTETGDAATEPHGARVRYDFDPLTGALVSIEFDVTNATEFAMLDMSGINSKSAVSKSSLSAAGSRNGMNGNVTEVQGRAETEAKLDAVIASLASLTSELAKLKSPVAVPGRE